MSNNQAHHATSTPRLMSMRDVVTLTTYARPSIYRLVAQGRFPPPLKLGQTKIAFRADDVEAWLASRPKIREAGYETPKPPEDAAVPAA
jgi:prophage regulatory protein